MAELDDQSFTSLPLMTRAESLDGSNGSSMSAVILIQIEVEVLIALFKSAWLLTVVALVYP